MYNICQNRMKEKTTTAVTLDEFVENMTKKQGFIKAMWCGDEACESKIKELTGAKSRCIPYVQEKISDNCVCCGKPAEKMVIWAKQY